MDEKYLLSSPKRVRYFNGKVLSAEDFTAEQEYHLEKFRRHNRYLHGVGIVIGLEVSVSGDSSAGWKVVVHTGYALDSQGREIVVSTPHEEAIACIDKTTYVCLHYAERETDPSPVADEAGDAELFEHSRIEEFFSIKFEASDSCSDDGIRLARLKCKKNAWKINKKFRRPLIKD